MSASSAATQETFVPEPVLGVVSDHMVNPSTGWSIGCFGALAEFIRDADEAATFHQSSHTLSAVTDRGGIRLRVTPGTRLFASEGVTKDSWSQRVSLCLPREAAAMNQRTLLTMLGPDEHALRDSDRDGILFDLGLGSVQLDACVRVTDLAHARALEGLCGRPVFEHDNPAMMLILKVSPHRVFLSRVGRVEVFQRIPPPDGKSPDGPHTHVLPKLLRNGLTHPATEPVPEGFVPCAHFYPAHPMKDGMGVPHAYDPAVDEAFQQLLAAFGDPEAVELKRKVARAVANGQSPIELPLPHGRYARATVRACLRQLKARGASGSLAAWQTAHDRPKGEDADLEDASAPGHG